MFDTHATNLERTQYHKDSPNPTDESNLCLPEMSGWSAVAGRLSFPLETLPRGTSLRESQPEPSKRALPDLSWLYCVLALVLLALVYPAFLLWQDAPHGLHSLIRLGVSLGALALIVAVGWIASLFVHD